MHRQFTARQVKACRTRHLVFVYGSLRRGSTNAMSVRFPNSKYVGVATVKGRLFDLGDYPALQLDDDSTVCGEAYEVDDELLKVLDDFESSSDYYRKEVDVSINSQSRVAWIYLPSSDLKYSDDLLIASGDWVDFAKAKPDFTGRSGTDPTRTE